MKEFSGFPLVYCVRLSAWLPRHLSLLPNIPHDTAQASVALLRAHPPSFIWSPFSKKFYKLCHPAATYSPAYCLQCPCFSFLWLYSHTLYLLHIFSLHTVKINEGTICWLLHSSHLLYFSSCIPCPASFLNSTIILLANAQWVAFCDSCVFFYLGWTQWIYFHLIFMHLGFLP